MEDQIIGGNAEKQTGGSEEPNRYPFNEPTNGAFLKPDDQIIGGGLEPVKAPDSYSVYKVPSDKTLLEQIQYIRSKPTTYVFLFGKTQAGKTAIASSLIHHLQRDLQGDFGLVRNEQNVEGEKLGRQIQSLIQEGRFPNRTSVGAVTHIDLQYRPRDVRKEQVNVTLIEMSGEDLHELVVDQKSKLPDNIEVFFKAGNISMIFMLITSAAEAQKDENLMLQFMDYLASKDKKFTQSRIILLISQWDKYFGLNPETVAEFLESKLPAVYAKINRPDASNAIAKYTLGDVESNVDGKPFIRVFDHESPKMLWNWLYATITGYPLSDPPVVPKKSGFTKFREWFFGMK